MKTIDRTKPIMVTGANGYVASWIIKRLLDEGLTIHATVRDKNNLEKISHLKQLEANSKGKIVFFNADLLQPDSFLEAMQNCELVFHTASPFKINVKNNEEDLIKPALIGTRNVLECVNKTPSIKRVVLTSSVAAVYGDNKDILNTPNKILNESNWNTTSNLNHQPYSYSKLIAEKEAWEINKQQQQWDLITINPALVIGPSLHPKITSGSYEIIKQLINGKSAMGVPNLWFATVDVRDVAEAHYCAAFNPAASGRYIISNECVTLLQIANIIKENFNKKFKLPSKELPKFLIWLVGPFIGIERKFVQNNIGYKLNIDNKKSKNDLKINYKSLNESVIEFINSLIVHKRVRIK